MAITEADVTNASTTQYQGMWFDQGGNFNFRYVTASGASSALNSTNVQRGLGQARPALLQGRFHVGGSVRVRIEGKAPVAYGHPKFEPLARHFDHDTPRREALMFGLQQDALILAGLL